MTGGAPFHGTLAPVSGIVASGSEFGELVGN